MLATPHMLVGAGIARRVRPPWLAITLAFLSHFVLDMTPHLDSHSMFGVDSGGTTLAEAASAVVDFLIGVAVVWWLTRNRKRSGWILAGAFAGILIDLVDNVPLWLYWFRASTLGSWVSHFHHGIQHNLPAGQWVMGFGTQAVAIGIALLLLKLGGTRTEASDAGGVLH